MRLMRTVSPGLDRVVQRALDVRAPFIAFELHPSGVVGGDALDDAHGAADQRIGIARNAGTVEPAADAAPSDEDVDERQDAGGRDADPRRVGDESDHAAEQNRGAEQEQIEAADRAEHDLEQHHERAEDDQSPVQSVHVPHANPPRAGGQGGVGGPPVSRSENGQRRVGAAE